MKNPRLPGSYTTLGLVLSGNVVIEKRHLGALECDVKSKAVTQKVNFRCEK